MSTTATTPIPAEEVAARLCMKVAYENAYSAFKKMKKHNQSGKHRKPITQVYLCRCCQKFHLTSAKVDASRGRMASVPLKSVARDPKMPIYKMLEIAFVGTPSERVVLAQNVALTPEVIYILADPTNPVAVRKKLAQRSDLSLGTQKLLAKDVRAVRTSLAYNPHTSLSVLTSLAATDPDLDEVVRLNPAMAESAYTPSKSLIALVRRDAR